MIGKYDKKVHNIAEYNLPHGILNPSKPTKDVNSHYYPFLHVCMNTIKGKEKFKYFRILLDNGCNPPL